MNKEQLWLLVASFIFTVWAAVGVLHIIGVL